MLINKSTISSLYCIQVTFVVVSYFDKSCLNFGYNRFHGPSINYVQVHIVTIEIPVYFIKYYIIFLRIQSSLIIKHKFIFIINIILVKYLNL